MKRTILLGLVAAGLLFSGAARATTQLITEEEARLPPPKGAIAADRRGIMRGPKVEFVSPGDSVNSPLRLVLKFESYGGAKIDPESVKVIFLRSPNVDLTARVKPFVQPDGINMQDAELPPGEYTVRVDIKDSDGRPGTAIFTLKVAPK
ncbi:hypothetical protein [Bradyrhizobium niftali]|jgi:hypothetical protein|uniref:Uncharacterized protein n=1 Tax=Bradyrhizobium niftali TaxID=2560055 RepID=A0A4Y9M6K3_9BRAD|nr:hypothetical protein [Bradyrhizobium niftali]TFV50745.1 hypothetical protein E4K65_01180 [Bradyrhizobium niftali]